MARSETEPEVCSYESLLRFLLRFRFGRAWNTRRRKSVTLDPSEATRPVKNCRQFEAASLAAKEGHARRSRLISASKRESFISSLVGLVSLLFFFFFFFFFFVRRFSTFTAINPPRNISVSANFWQFGSAFYGNLRAVRAWNLPASLSPDDAFRRWHRKRSIIPIV